MIVGLVLEIAMSHPQNARDWTICLIHEVRGRSKERKNTLMTGHHFNVINLAFQAALLHVDETSAARLHAPHSFALIAKGCMIHLNKSELQESWKCAGHHRDFGKEGLRSNCYCPRELGFDQFGMLSILGFYVARLSTILSDLMECLSLSTSLKLS